MAKRYENFYKATGYGTVEGLGGANCRHSFYPYFEGSKPSLTRQELAKLNDKTVPYQGKQIPQEEALAIQRSYERQVKRWKREEAVAKGALPLMAPDQTKAKAKIKEYQGKLRAFTEETGLKRDYTRERM